MRTLLLSLFPIMFYLSGISPAQYAERDFTCLAAFAGTVNAAKPTSMEDAFLYGPWRPPVSERTIDHGYIGTFTNASARAWFVEGMTRFHLLDANEAEAAFRQALTLEPTAPAAAWGLTLANWRPSYLSGSDDRVRFFHRETMRLLANRRDLPTLERELIRSFKVGNPAPILEELALAQPTNTAIQALHVHAVLLDDLSGKRPIANHLANALQLDRLPPDHPAQSLRVPLWRDHSKVPDRSRTAKRLTEAMPNRAIVWQSSADAHSLDGDLETAILHAARAIECAAESGQATQADPSQLLELLLEAGRYRELTNTCVRLLGQAASLEENERCAPETALTFWGQAAFLLDREADFLAACQKKKVTQLPVGLRAAMVAGFYEGLCHVSLGQRDKADKVLRRLKADLQRSGAKDDTTRAPVMALRDLLAGRIPSTALLPSPARARLLLLFGKPELAIKTLRQRPTFLSTGMRIDLLRQLNLLTEAQKLFTRGFIAQAQQADPELNLLSRLHPIAVQMKQARWRFHRPAKPPALAFARPSGPAAQLDRMDGSSFTFQKPKQTTVLNFFMGVACPACLAQLAQHEPQRERLAEAGIDLLNICPNSIQRLVEVDLPYDILSDADGDAFQAFGVHDLFENRPLHGTIVVSPAGKIVLKIVSEIPFKQPEALLREIRRLTDAD